MSSLKPRKTLLEKFTIPLNAMQVKMLEAAYSRHSGEYMLMIEPRLNDRLLKCAVIHREFGDKLHAIIAKEFSKECNQ